MSLVRLSSRAVARGSRLGAAERGVSVVEFAVLMPALLVFIFLLIQAGLYYHARNVTQAVAESTARAVRGYQGAPGQPQTQLPSLAQLTALASQQAVSSWRALDGGSTTSQPQIVSVTLDGFNQVTIVLRTRSTNLLPGLFPDTSVVARAGGPIEVFKQQGTN